MYADTPTNTDHVWKNSAAGSNCQASSPNSGKGNIHTHSHTHLHVTYIEHTLYVPVRVTLWSMHIRSQACLMMMNKSWSGLEGLRTLGAMHLLALVLPDTHTPTCTYIQTTVNVPVIVTLR